jgi:hypothetical protein
MRTMWLALLGVGMCLNLVPGLARAQEDEARGLIDKAIKAHGGEKALEKTKAIQVKSKGTVHQPTGELAFTSEDYWQSPDKFKNVIKATIMGKAYTEVKAFDGKKGWIQTNDVVKDFDDKTLEVIKEAIYAEQVGQLLILKDKKFKLAPLGEVKVEGRPAVGVRVSSKGHKDVNLFFDKAKHLLVKSEVRLTKPGSDQEITQEKIYLDYKKVDDVQMPTKAIVLMDGKKLVDVVVTETQFVDGFDASVFAKP